MIQEFHLVLFGIISASWYYYSKVRCHQFGSTNLDPLYLDFRSHKQHFLPVGGNIREVEESIRQYML